MHRVELKSNGGGDGHSLCPVKGFLMHRVELKVPRGGQARRARQLFLMHRVELKVLGYEDSFVWKFVAFLMHRVELKE